jgi:hypothetical protein
MVGAMSSSSHRTRADGRKARATRLRWRRCSSPSMARITVPMTGPMVSALMREGKRSASRSTSSTSAKRVSIHISRTETLDGHDRIRRGGRSAQKP